MSDIKDWSNSAGGNTAAAPDGFPENMAPSGVNDAARETMASLRRQHEDAEWIDWGHIPTFATTANFTVAGDYSSLYHAGRRIKANDNSILYGTVASVTYSTNTRVSVAWDSGEMTASLTGVAVGILSFDNKAYPATIADTSATNTFVAKQVFSKGVEVSGTASFTESVVVGGNLSISATASFGSKVVFNSGVEVSGSISGSASLAGSFWPSFSAYPAALYSISALVVTKVQFDTEAFDTNSDFDSTTNYRFTPTVAGKYLLTATIAWNAPYEDQKLMIIHIYKNGANYREAKWSSSGTSAQGPNVTCVVDANGTTDYFEVFVTQNSSSTQVLQGGSDGLYSYFEGSRIG
jgi:hypothetical protein